MSSTINPLTTKAVDLPTPPVLPSQEKEETPTISSSTTSSLEARKRDEDFYKSLVEKKDKETRESLKSHFALSKVSKFPLKILLFANLFAITDFIKNQKVVKKNDSLSLNLEQLDEIIFSIHSKMDAIDEKKRPSLKNEIFSAIEKWGEISRSLSENLSNEYLAEWSQNIAEYDRLVRSLPSFLVSEKLEKLFEHDLKDERPSWEFLSWTTSVGSSKMFDGLLIIAKMLKNQAQEDLKKLENSIFSQMKKIKLKEDPFKTALTTLTQFSEACDAVELTLNKDESIFNFKKGIGSIDVPQKDFVSHAETFCKKGKVNQNKGQLECEKAKKLGQHSPSEEKLAKTSLSNKENLFKQLSECHHTLHQALQILSDLNSLFRECRQRVEKFLDKTDEIFRWNNENYGNQDYWNLSHIFFLHFLHQLESVPHLEKRKALEQDLFTVFRMTVICYEPLETHVDSQTFHGFYRDLLNKCAELRKNLLAALDLSVEDATVNAFFHAFSLFSDLLHQSPQSISVFYLQPKPFPCGRATANQSLLLRNLEFYRRFVETIDYRPIEVFLRSIKGEDGNVQAFTNQIQKYVKGQKRLRSLVIDIIPEDISLESVNPLIEELVYFFKHFIRQENEMDALIKTQKNVDYLMFLLPKKNHDEDPLLNIGVFTQGYCCFGLPVENYHRREIESKRSKNISKPSLSSFTLPSPKKERNTLPTTSSIISIPVPAKEISPMEALILQTKKNPIPRTIAHENPSHTELRFFQIQGCFENIVYYQSLIGEFLAYPEELSFPLSFVHLLELFSTLTIEQSEKAILAHLPFVFKTDPLTHILFKEMSQSNSKNLVRSSHNIERLWSLLEKWDPKSFKIDKKEQSHIDSCAYLTIDSRYPLLAKRMPISSKLYQSLYVKKDAFDGHLKSCMQNADFSLRFSAKAIHYFGDDDFSFSPISAPAFKPVVSNEIGPRIQELLDLCALLAKKRSGWLEEFAVANLPFNLMLINEMYCCKERSKIRQSYAQILSSGSFVVLELSVLFCESHLQLKKFGSAQNPEWESHDLSDFPSLLGRDEFFTEEESRLLAMAQNVLKRETRYPTSFYGEVSEDLLKLQTLCQWREGVKPDGWLSEEMLYEMKHTYKKEITGDLVKEIESDSDEILKRIQTRAEKTLALSKKILTLIT